MSHRLPIRLLSTQTDELLRLLPGVRDGDSDAVHDARVATRRLREILPLFGPDGAAATTLTIVRKAGRALGRTRELDVMNEHLAEQERHLPAAAQGIAATRGTLVPRLERSRRRMIKTFDRLELEIALPKLISEVAHEARGAGRGRRAVPWMVRLQRRIREEAASVAAAVRHAGGVYFPNRLHGTRIEVKKLRYALELAAEAGESLPHNLLRDLKRAQATLGSIHDIQVLLEFYDDAAAGDEVAREIFAGVLAAERRMLHEEYLARRERLLEIAEECERIADRKHGGFFNAIRRPAVAVSIVAVPATLALITRRTA